MGCSIPDDLVGSQCVAGGGAGERKMRMTTVKMRLMKAAKAGGRACLACRRNAGRGSAQGAGRLDRYRLIEGEGFAGRFRRCLLSVVAKFSETV